MFTNVTSEHHYTWSCDDISDKTCGDVHYNFITEYH